MPAALFLLALAAVATAQQCGPEQHDVVIGANNIYQTSVPTIDACCTLCQKNESCVAFTFSNHAEAGLNCWLKDNLDSHPALGRISAVLNRSTPARVTVADQAIFTVEPEYASFTIDTSRNRAFFDVNLNNSYLWYMAKQLTPAFLRVGGSGGDVLDYDIPTGTTTCNSPTSCSPAANGDCCLNVSTWASLCEFAQQSGAKLIFALNRHLDLKGSQVQGLLHDALARKCPIWGFELGNEYGCPDNGGGFGELYEVVKELWPDEATRPKLLGPDADQNQSPGECITGFLDSLQQQGVPIHAATYHYYVQVSSPSQPASTLNNLRPYATSFRDGIFKSSAAKTTQVWMGETGGHSGGGHAGATDSVASGQWYLDSLGMLSTLNHSVHCRQDFFGANYGLLDYSIYTDGTTLLPRPDFFTTVLWKRVVGTTVLPAAVSVQGKSVQDGNLRAYAFCAGQGAPSGAATLVLINLSPNSMNVTAALPGSTRQDYLLSAPPGQENTPNLLLNGKPVQLTAHLTLPPLDPVSASTTAGIQLPAGGYGFFVFPQAGFSACK